LGRKPSKIAIFRAFFSELFTKTRISPEKQKTKIQNFDMLYLTICPNFPIFFALAENVADFFYFGSKWSTCFPTSAPSSGIQLSKEVCYTSVASNLSSQQPKRSNHSFSQNPTENRYPQLYMSKNHT